MKRISIEAFHHCLEIKTVWLTFISASISTPSLIGLQVTHGHHLGHGSCLREIVAEGIWLDLCSTWNEKYEVSCSHNSWLLKRHLIHFIPEENLKQAAPVWDGCTVSASFVRHMLPWGFYSSQSWLCTKPFFWVYCWEDPGIRINELSASCEWLRLVQPDPLALEVIGHLQSANATYASKTWKCLRSYLGLLPPVHPSCLPYTWSEKGSCRHRMQSMPLNYWHMCLSTNSIKVRQSSGGDKVQKTCKEESSI